MRVIFSALQYGVTPSGHAEGIYVGQGHLEIKVVFHHSTMFMLSY